MTNNDPIEIQVQVGGNGVPCKELLHAPNLSLEDNDSISRFCREKSSDHLHAPLLKKALDFRNMQRKQMAERVRESRSIAARNETAPLTDLLLQSLASEIEREKSQPPTLFS